jgi:pimeloyl-ACP methyl ester carboxylesterase
VGIQRLVVAAFSFTFIAIAGIANAANVTGATANPAVSQTCGKGIESSIAYDYCIFPSSDPSNKDLMIHLHGLGGDAMSWMNNPYYQAARDEMHAQGKSVPTVITVSLGKLWLLTEVTSRGNRYSVVVNQIIPHLEQVAGFNGQGRRFLMGESMGGFNALQIFFRNPNTFAKVAILCPAVADLTPWATATEISDYVKRTGAEAARVAFFMHVAGDEFPTAADWNKSNPLLLASNFASSSSQFYLSGDERDEYGFIEGALKLDATMKSKFSNYSYETVPNAGHCTINSHSIAKLLSSP